MSNLKQKYDSGELHVYIEDFMRDMMNFTNAVVRYCSLVIEDGDEEVHVTLVGVKK